RPGLSITVPEASTPSQIGGHHQAFYTAGISQCLEETEVPAAVLKSWRQKIRTQRTDVASMTTGGRSIAAVCFSYQRLPEFEFARNRLVL
ncbi:MAG: hypothetical protein OEV47_11340, partial [Gammaproteobacteria bacterium]|nr:hypothetical protein [Gammaproteobacteria bacterium]